MKIRSLHPILSLAFLPVFITATPVFGLPGFGGPCTIYDDGGGVECFDERGPRYPHTDLGWVVSPNDTCPGPGEVCADWVDQFSVPVGPSCCIPAWAIGTQQVEACRDDAVAGLIFLRLG